MSQDNAVLLKGKTIKPETKRHSPISQQTQSPELLALPSLFYFKSFIYILPIPQLCHFIGPQTKSLEQTSTAWQCYTDYLGVAKRLWCCRLISVWLKLAELPYQVSSWRRRKGTVSRLAKQQRYHMMATANGCTSHPFFCARRRLVAALDSVFRAQNFYISISVCLQNHVAAAAIKQ